MDGKFKDKLLASRTRIKNVEVSVMLFKRVWKRIGDTKSRIKEKKIRKKEKDNKSKQENKSIIGGIKDDLIIKSSTELLKNGDEENEYKGNEDTEIEHKGNEDEGIKNKGNEDKGEKNKGKEDKKNKDKGEKNKGNEDKKNKDKGEKNKGNEDKKNKDKGNKDKENKDKKKRDKGNKDMGKEDEVFIHVKTIKPDELTGDRKWLWDEYERHIGVPKRKDTEPSRALVGLRSKKRTKCVPEAYFYHEEPITTDAMCLSAKKPIRKCFCSFRECFCTVNTTKNRNHLFGGFSINISRYVDLPTIRRFRVCLGRANVKPYIEQITQVIGTPGRPQEGLYSVAAPNNEFCITRCINCQTTADFQHILYLPMFAKLKDFEALMEQTFQEDADESDVMPSEGVIEDVVCNMYTCTVATQTKFGPNGELDISEISHALYSNAYKTVLPDINGKKLELFQVNYVPSPSPVDPDVQLSNVDKLLEFKVIKSRIAKLISLLLGIEDPGPPVPLEEINEDETSESSSCCCCDEDCENIQQMPWSYKLCKNLQGDFTKEVCEEVQEEDNSYRCCQPLDAKEGPVEKMRCDYSLSKKEGMPCVKSLKDNCIKPDYSNTRRHRSCGEVQKLKTTSVSNVSKKCCDLKRNETNDLNKCEYKLKNMCNHDINDSPNVSEDLEKCKDTSENKIDEESIDKIKQSGILTETQEKISQGNLSSISVTSEKTEVQIISNCDIILLKKSSLDEGGNSKSVIENNSKIIVRENYANKINSRDEQDMDSICDNKDINSLLKKSDKEQVQKSEIGSKCSRKSKFSKDKICTFSSSYKKVSGVFKCLLDQIFSSGQLNKNSSEDSSAAEDNLKVRESKMSEREVFSLRYTSTPSIIKNSSSEKNR